MERIAIIVAGGSGERMGGATRKQFLDLAGVPVLVRSVQLFTGIASRIVVVLPRGEVQRWDQMAAEYGLQTEICTGGGTRFESVRNALKMLGVVDGVVAVHDGVRPLAGRELVERIFEQAERHGSAVPTVAAVDSFRLDGAVVDRNRLRAVQTPQAFRGEWLVEAYDKAAGIRVGRGALTDDAAVVEIAGRELNLVEGLPENIKITTPLDLIIASAILKSSGE